MDNIHEKVNEAAKYIIVASALQSESGTMCIYASEIPDEIMLPDEFTCHIKEITKVLSSYKSVLDVTIESDDFIMINIGSDYCPYYETICGEVKLDENRIIKDSLRE